jgi:hypothetical protein
VKLKLSAFVDAPPAVDPAETVVAVAELLDILTVGVPVYVKPVAVAVVNTVPDPVVVMFPVPKIIDRVLELLEKNNPVDKVEVLVPTSSVPAVNVYVAFVANVVVPLANCTVPAPDCVIENSVLLADVMTAVPEVLAHVQRPEPVVNVIPDTKVNEP